MKKPMRFKIFKGTFGRKLCHWDLIDHDLWTGFGQSDRNYTRAQAAREAARRFAAKYGCDAEFVRDER